MEKGFKRAIVCGLAAAAIFAGLDYVYDRTQLANKYASVGKVIQYNQEGSPLASDEADEVRNWISNQRKDKGFFVLTKEINELENKLNDAVSVSSTNKPWDYSPLYSAGKHRESQ